MAATGVLPFLRGIDFTKNDFKDEFPENVQHMSSLTWLKANKTQLSNIPQSVTKLNKLEDLHLCRNEIDELPQEITEMNGLRSLNLRHNKLKKEGIPYSLFDLEELTTLDFSHNALDQCPPNIHNAKTLLVLNVAFNRIKEVPPSLFTQLSYLQHLDISHNQIEYIPPQIRRLQCLHTLNISNNPLQHDQFRSLSGLIELQSLNISCTQRGINNIPAEFDKLINLTEIDLSYNNLTRIPEPVYRLEKLKRAKFSHNSISEMSSLTECWTELVTLNMTENKLTEIPGCICKLTKLKRLYLNGNNITFEGVPSGIGKLTNLEVFLAARNKLTCIPDSLCRCVKLKQMDLSSNELMTLPNSIWDLKELKVLNTEENPSLVMPAKPPAEVKGSGVEFYNVDFSLYNQRKVAGLKPAEETMPEKDKEKEKKERRARLRRKQSLFKTEDSESVMESNKIIKGLSEYKEDNDSVSFYLSSRSRMADQSAALEEASRKEAKAKKWTDALTRPSLDYTDLFPEIVQGTVGQEEGLYMWRINDFLPLLMDDAVGRFYEADCYIVLNSEFKDNSVHLSYNIHFWIGGKSEIDKKACAAIHAVNLRNLLGCDNRTIREEQGEESDEFVLYFDGDMEVMEGGSESGFFQVEETVYIKRLFKCHGINNVQLEPVPCAVSSIDHRHSYLLDDGMEITLWFGKYSKLTQRKKASLFAEKINNVERKNSATIVSINSYDDEKQHVFFKKLSGNREEIPIPYENEKPDDKEDLYSVPAPKLYEVHLGVGYLELPQLDISATKPMTQALLRSQKVYLLDCFTDLFVWVGSHSDRLLRAAAAKLSNELLRMIGRPSTAIVTTNFEGVESALFRSFFDKWDNVVAVDFTRAADKAIAPVDTDAPMKVDLTALFLPRQEPLSSVECGELSAQFNEDLESMESVVMEGRKFTKLPVEELGHFYSENCYVFLCTYWTSIGDFSDEMLEQYALLQKNANTGKLGVEGAPAPDTEQGEEEEEEEETLVCRVYFWQGRDASKMCWPQFSLSSFKKKIEEAFGSKMPMEIERCFQQQENLKLLSHFHGRNILHKGKRPTPGHIPAEPPVRKPQLYQLRQNGNSLAQRCVEIGCSSLLLNSGFCYILKVPVQSEGVDSSILYVWVGSKSTEELMNAAVEIGSESFENTSSVTTLYEGTNEPDIFWQAVGGRRAYETSAEFMDSIRLFRCSNERGYFAVSEKCSDFCQDDLADEDVMILDSGNDVFVWIGEESSDVERKLGLKSAQLYSQHVKDMTGNARKLCVMRRGKENLKFIKLFHGWGVFRSREKI